jgi:hypothetical protein
MKYTKRLLRKQVSEASTVAQVFFVEGDVLILDLNNRVSRKFRSSIKHSTIRMDSLSMGPNKTLDKPQVTITPSY